MAYTWTNGEVITAEKLNQTGDGAYFLVTISQDLEDNFTMDKTLDEIYTAYSNGLLPIAMYVYNTIPQGMLQLRFPPVSDGSFRSVDFFGFYFGDPTRMFFADLYIYFDPEEDDEEYVYEFESYEVARTTP